MQHPSHFLEVRIHNTELSPGLSALCAGYENGEWRSEQLAVHLTEWLPEFALSHTEREGLGSQNAVALLAQAAKAVYTSPKYQNRGEIGELLLHIAVCQVFDTIPAISKYFFKDASNDTVKGFDAVHVVASIDSLELWLGEVKFYKNIQAAIRDVVSELKQHTERDYLRSEFATITNKIDDNWPYADRLRKLIHKNTSLDDVFDRMCIPVFLSYESHVMISHTKVTKLFKKALATEIVKHYKSFSSKSLPGNIRIHLFLFPMECKSDLVTEFDKRLKSWQ